MNILIGWGKYLTAKRRLSPKGVFLEMFIIGSVLGTISIWLGAIYGKVVVLCLGYLLWIEGITFGILCYFREKSFRENLQRTENPEKSD